LSAENGQESRIWELYSHLVTSTSEVDDLGEEEAFKAAQLMQKATATFMQTDKDWSKTSAGANQALQLANDYAESKICV
jgi:hypothetical protein